MDTTKIVEAIKLIPEKKENLRKAFEALQSYSSSLSTFTLQWKDLEDDISSIESSIYHRLYSLQKQDIHYTATLTPIPSTTTTMTAPEVEIGNTNNTTINATTTTTLRPELKYLCANMDAKGLRSFLSTSHNVLRAIRDELALALQSATDPALLVLDTLDGIHPPNPPPPNMKAAAGFREGGLQIALGICINLLENLHSISSNIEIKDFVRQRALKLAVEWKGRVPEKGHNALQALGFLLLIVSYGLVSEFEMDDVMELFVCISGRNQAVDLIGSLGFVDKAHDLIQKLSSKGRQLDAVKIIYGLNIVEKFPPVPLLKAYIYESNKRANELRKTGNYSVQAQNESTAKEVHALKSVLKAIEEHKLESEYPRENLVKRIAQLEDRKKADKKRAAASVAASNSKTMQKQQSNKRTAAVASSNSMTQLKQQSNKRPHPSLATSSAATSAPVTAANSYPPLLQPHSQLGLAERAPYMGVAGPYGRPATGSVYSHDASSLSSGLVPTGSVYNHGAPSLSSGLAATGSVHNHGGQGVNSIAMGHGGPGLSGIAMGQGGTHSPPRSYYSLESLVGTNSLCDRPVAHHGHPSAGVPSTYGSSLYP